MLNLFDMYKSAQDNEQDIFPFHSEALEKLERELDILEVQLANTQHNVDAYFGKIDGVSMLKKLQSGDVDAVSYSYSSTHVSMWMNDIVKYKNQINVKKESIRTVMDKLMEEHLDTLTNLTVEMIKKHFSASIPDDNAAVELKKKIMKSLKVLIKCRVLPLDEMSIILKILNKGLSEIGKKNMIGTPYNLTITMLIVATKLHIETPFNNKTWGGIFDGTLADLNAMELKVIEAIGIIKMIDQKPEFPGSTYIAVPDAHINMIDQKHEFPGSTYLAVKDEHVAKKQKMGNNNTQ